MAKGKKVCKVCGQEYEACHTMRPITGEFRWQDVACCPEHGQEYLRRIMISRGQLREEPVKAAEPEEKPVAPKQTRRKRKTSAEKAE